jgi:hypothetical protein
MWLVAASKSSNCFHPPLFTSRTHTHPMSSTVVLFPSKTEMASMCRKSDKERSEMKKIPTDARPEEHQSSLSRKRRGNKKSKKSKAEMMIDLLRLEKERSRLVQKCMELEETAQSTQAAWIKSRTTLLMKDSLLRTRVEMLEEDTGYLKEKAYSLQAKFFELNIEAASKENRIKILVTAIQENVATVQKSDRKEVPTTKSIDSSSTQQIWTGMKIFQSPRSHPL